MSDEKENLTSRLIDAGLKAMRMERVTKIGNEYSDNKGNFLTDGYPYDVAQCKNHANPSAKQMADAIQQYYTGTPIQPGSSTRVFKQGTSPLTRMCDNAR